MHRGLFILQCKACALPLCQEPTLNAHQRSCDGLLHGRGLGNVTGYPGVFQSNPCPYPSKPVPASMSAGFRGYGSRVYENPRVPQPARGYASQNDQ
ncbi:hypothetical protein K443DRAFT_219270 [Laccaria amethystina LaAM-08-1]|uniref:Uncharacterized protein n=1 Tax=Laccaria amethystina LaAM-08-1 TaxID=1095629 RepID=A0A0C9WZ90_9AGAR|nr:hypothetical protein K443DRAFT_219270 [Laccaria amethystina LaAM-08-1]